MTGWWPEGFLAPDRLMALAAVAVVAAVHIGLAVARPRYALRFTDVSLLDTVAPRRPGWRRHVATAAFLVGLAAAVLAWARPTDVVMVPKERATVVLAIDTSYSMEATDVAPDRIRAAQAAALAFVGDLPTTMNVGLVTFDGVARVRVTPTLDREQVRTAIEGIDLGPATAIGEAIFAGLDAIATAPVADLDGEPIPAHVVVMTDGKTTVGRSDTSAARAAGEAGVPVSTIAFGTDRGFVLIDGAWQAVPVEVSALRLIAEQSGGRFFRAESLGELESIYRDIGSSIGLEEEEVEVADRFAGIAVLLLVIGAGLSIAFSPRLP